MDNRITRTTRVEEPEKKKRMSGSSNNSKKDDPVPSGRDRWVASHTDNTQEEKERCIETSLVPPYTVVVVVVVVVCESCYTRHTMRE